MKLQQLSVGVGLILLGAALGGGALSFRADPSYSGIGPAFYPGLVAGLLVICGVMLSREALTGGFRKLGALERGVPGFIRGFLLLSGALLLTAFLVTRVGFPISCALLFAVVTYAFGSKRYVVNFGVGLVISLLMYWAFAKGLGMSLPALISGGWI